MFLSLNLSDCLCSHWFIPDSPGPTVVCGYCCTGDRYSEPCHIPCPLVSVRTPRLYSNMTHGCRGRSWCPPQSPWPSFASSVCLFPSCLTCALMPIVCTCDLQRISCGHGGSCPYRAHGAWESHTSPPLPSHTRG